MCRRGVTSPEWGTPVPATRTARVSIQERQAYPLPSQLTSEPAQLRTLARRYFAHDFEGQTHARNVARLALRIASGFALAREDLVAIAVGATLHDIGKLTVPAAVLETPGHAHERRMDARPNSSGAR